MTQKNSTVQPELSINKLQWMVSLIRSGAAVGFCEHYVGPNDEYLKLSLARDEKTKLRAEVFQKAEMNAEMDRMNFPTLQDKAQQIAEAGEPVAVTNYGNVVGLFIPVSGGACGE